MTDLQKAVEMALKFCDDLGELGGPYPYVNGTGVVFDSRQISKALRQALAQPEQEPVIFYRCNGCGHAYEQVAPSSCDCMDGTKFQSVNYYTAPPSIEAAVLAEREACAKVCEAMDHDGVMIAKDCAAAIRARSEK